MFVKKIEKRIHKEVSPDIAVTFENGCVVLRGESDNWDNVIKAGTLAVDKIHSRGVVNDIILKGHDYKPMRIPAISDKTYDNLSVDVAVIGGGVIGCLIARRLAGYDIKIALIEKEYDVATAATGRNDGMVHPGIDLHRNTNKFKYNQPGNKMYPELCKELGVEFRRNGSYMTFDKRWQRALYPIFKIKANSLNIPNVRYASKKELHKIEPELGKWAQGAGFFGSSGIVSPYKLTVAAAENAVANGVILCLNTAVLAMERQNDTITVIKTNRGDIRPKLVINAAGVYSDIIAEYGGDRFFTIHPRKGTDIILDTKSLAVSTVIARTPFFKEKLGHTKGGGIVKTIDGNVLVGPNSEEIPDKEDVATSAKDVAAIIKKHERCAQRLNAGQIIAYFAGVRAATYEEDFIVQKSERTKNLLFAAGIQSPGLTAAPAIAEDITKMAVEMLGNPPVNPNYNPIRKPTPHIAGLSFDERQKMIEKNPDYGVIICRCEQVSRGEIIDAIHSPIPALTLDAVKRRVRPGMGRCQGGFCGPLVAEIISEQAHIPLFEVCKCGEDSRLIAEQNKEGYSDEI